MRIALGIEYDGTDFFGWQRLSHGETVQQAVESALSFVAAHPVEVTCAGRTDAGVHARCQVVHFDTTARRSERGWTLGANSRLPRTIGMRWARPVADDFHARFGAIARRYRYTIVNRQTRPVLEARYVAWERGPLDAARMHEAAQALVGEHDFSAFRTVHCQASRPIRRVDHLHVARDGDTVTIDVQANAFLHHMVRNFVGSLLPIGRGEQPVGWLRTLLDGRDRAVAGPTAVASGLVFVGPLFPAAAGLPDDVSIGA